MNELISEHLNSQLSFVLSASGSAFIHDRLSHIKAVNSLLVLAKHAVRLSKVLSDSELCLLSQASLVVLQHGLAMADSTAIITGFEEEV